MVHKGRQRIEALFDQMFPHDFNGVLPEIPNWVKRGIVRKVENGQLVLVSAVCPDYERINGRFTYRAMGDGLPFTAVEHLPIVKHVHSTLQTAGIEVDYHITLADTEFDLPLAVEHLAGGDPDLFLARCERSCERLREEALRLGLPIQSSERFTVAFQNWFPAYHAALEVVEREAQEDSSVRLELTWGINRRMPLHRAMAGREVTSDYCRYMVIRQWAQYMAWGKCAEERYGPSLAMMNHDTPNLSRINHPLFRAGKERIPILKLAISTMPE